MAADPRTSPIAVQRDDIAHITLHGDRAAEVLNGLVSNEVAALSPGEGCYAVALNPKGKIVADLVVLRAADRVVTEATREASPGWLSTIRKYVNPRLAKATDDTDSIDTVELVGSGAGDVLRALGAGLPPGDAGFAHHEGMLAETNVRIARLPLYGVEAVRLTSARGTGEAIRRALVSAGARAGTMADLEVARIEAGWPRWGRDMDESTLSQEANLDTLGAISFTKGCYTGQEYVARLHFRGHVNRFLRGILLDAVVPPGTPLVREDGTSVGDVRSVAISPRHGPLGVAMVRREVADGTVLRARWESGEAAARVVALPFPR